MKKFILIFFLFSCKNIPKDNNVFAQTPLIKLSKENLDTLKIKLDTIISDPVILEKAFIEGTIAKIDTFHTLFYAIDIGKINIESGKIIACDPILTRDAKPFLYSFPIGQFPVHLSIAKFGGDERIAFSRIYFSNNPVVRWEFALKEGQKQLPIYGENSYGYSVDAGIGVFIDEKANIEFNKNDSSFTELLNETDKHTHATWSYGIYKMNSHNVIAFSTGVGDGSYSTYIGYDSKGNPCRLLTDFGLIQWWLR